MFELWHWARVFFIGWCCCGCGATERDPEPSAGASGSGSTGGECNDLEPIDVQPECRSFETIPPATGGAIEDGVYSLVAYWTPGCTLDSGRTARITRMSDDTFGLELVMNAFDGRASGVFVTSGTSITTNYTCGGQPDPEVLHYSVIDDPAEGPQLYLLGEQSSLIFMRVFD